ncbi:hypothetical protein ACFTQ7_16515 [Lysinibacillus sp. NPDC056959]|uniref:hypothetical protein n=1 Tax=Lysinibacillus sp. NPDC056959 TaxID=3345981 RepID=UPI0036350345
MDINIRKAILTIVFFFLIFVSFVAYDYFKFDKFEWCMNFLKTFMTFFFMFLYKWASNDKKQVRKDQDGN